MTDLMLVGDILERISLTRVEQILKTLYKKVTKLIWQLRQNAWQRRKALLQQHLLSPQARLARHQWQIVAPSWVAWIVLFLAYIGQLPLSFHGREKSPPKGKKPLRGASESDPKSVTPSQCVKQYIGENLTVSNKKLFCLDCREELSVKSSVITYHIKSAKHISGKKTLETKRKADLEIVESL